MNIERTIAKLKTLSDHELQQLYKLVMAEKNVRIQFQSNATHTPNEIAQSLSTFFANARDQHN
jgi:hypothetical protein